MLVPLNLSNMEAKINTFAVLSPVFALQCSCVVVLQ